MGINVKLNLQIVYTFQALLRYKKKGKIKEK